MKLLLCVVFVCVPLVSPLAAVHYVDANNSTSVSPFTSWATAAGWSNVVASVNTTNNANVVLVPLASATRFFRLILP